MTKFDKKSADVLRVHQHDINNLEIVESNYSSNFNIDFVNNQVDSVSSEINSRFLPKRQQSDLLASVYEFLEMHRRADRVLSCGTWLEFGIFSDKNKLVFANFCKDRLCPMCNWRRSLKLYGQVSAVMDELEKQGYKFLFLTLTIKNCSAMKLSSTIDILLKGFTKLFHDNRRVKKAVKGFFRSLEITKNKQTGEYHPHLHCILAVKSTYFKGDYITQAEWAEIWQKCIDTEYLPIIDIRRIKSGGKGVSGAVREVAKYSVKGSDFLNSSDIDETAETVSDFLKALSFRRLVSFTGVFADIRKQMKLDDIEDGNLIQTDIDNIRSDVAIAIVRYGYKNGCYTLENIQKGGVSA